MLQGSAIEADYSAWSGPAFGAQGQAATRVVELQVTRVDGQLAQVAVPNRHQVSGSTR